MRFLHEQAARVCYAACRQLAEEQGDPRRPAWEMLDQAERAWWVQKVTRARMGWMPPDIHAAWLAELLDEGWRRGEVQDHARKTHPELTPWDEIAVKYQVRMHVLQMTAAAMTLDVPPVWSTRERVTAPLSGIHTQGMTGRTWRAIS